VDLPCLDPPAARVVVVEAGKLPNVTLQVLPFSKGQHAALGSGFSLLGLVVGGVRKSWAYTEDLTRADLLDGEAHVSAYRLAFVTLTETALPQRESMKLLEKAIGDPER
jgi:hypothetical protein